MKLLTFGAVGGVLLLVAIILFVIAIILDGRCQDKRLK